MMSACLGQQIILGSRAGVLLLFGGSGFLPGLQYPAYRDQTAPLPSVLLTAPQPACMAALHWPNGFGVRQRKLAHGLTVATTVPITKRNWMRTGNAECYQKAIPNMAVFWSCFDPRKRRNPYLSIELGGGSGKVFSTKNRSGLRPF